MNINFLSSGFLNNIRKQSISFASNPISNTDSDFKIQTSPIEDIFEKQPKTKDVSELPRLIEEIEKEIEEKTEYINQCMKKARKKAGKFWYWEEEAIKATKERDELHQKRKDLISLYNPNIAFLDDLNLTWPERKETLKSHPEIKCSPELNKYDTDSAFMTLWHDNRYFVVQKTNIGHFLDSSFELNKDNYDKLSDKNVLSFSEFCKKYNFELKDLNRYIKEGFIEPSKLTNLITNQKEDVHIFDDTKEINKAGIERHNQILNLIKESPFKDKEWIPVKYLSQLGFASEKKILESAKNYYRVIKTMPVKTANGIQNLPCIQNNTKIKGELKYLRNNNKNTVNKEELAKMTNISVTDIEDALLSGEVECVSQYLFDSDKGKILFNLRNKKTADFVNKKKFEYSLARQETKNKLSALNIIAWELCPNTRKVASKLLIQNPELKLIFEKYDKLKDYNERKEKGLLEEDEIEPKITNNEKIKIKVFYKDVWAAAGTEEFKNARLEASKAYLEYKEGGLDNVQNENTRQIIKNFLEQRKEI